MAHCCDARQGLVVCPYEPGAEGAPQRSRLEVEVQPIEDPHVDEAEATNGLLCSLEERVAFTLRHTVGDGSAFLPVCRDLVVVHRVIVSHTREFATSSGIAGAEEGGETTRHACDDKDCPQLQDDVDELADACHGVGQG